MATIRRWWGFMAVSALLNFVALALIGFFWRPLPPVTPPTAPKLMMLTLLPPTPRVKPPKMKPPPRPKPPAPKRQPRVMATPLPPAPRHTLKIAPTSSGGGSPKPRPRPKPARKLHLLDPVAPNADLSQANKTQNADLTDDDQDNDKGMADTDEKGKADTTIPGKTDASTSGAQGDQGTGRGEGKGGGLFGTKGDGGGGNGPRHVVYVLDISGSMNMTEQKFGGKTRIAQARLELDKRFQTLGDGETFSLIAFSTYVHLFRQELSKPDPDTIKAAEAFLDGLEPDGYTDLESALKAALTMPGVNVVVVITDGVPRTRKLDYETQEDFDKLASRIEATDTAKIPIFAYGLLGPNPDGTDDSKEAASFLTQIAADSHGKFVPVKMDGESQ